MPELWNNIIICDNKVITCDFVKPPLIHLLE